MFRRTHLIAMLAGCAFAGGDVRAEDALKQESATKEPVAKPVTKEPMTKAVTREPATKPVTNEPAGKSPAVKVVKGSRKKEPLVDVGKLCPPLVVELRYMTPRNLAGRAIYPADARCLVRESVAERLMLAQGWLEKHTPAGTSLKIWDGYRPAWAHKLLWHVLPNKEYLGDPQRLGSLHTWGVCVDATLCDAQGRDLAMPTDFDVLTPAARTYYEGDDETVKQNLRWLQTAMSAGGFMVVRDEWWHFVARDYEAFAPLDVPLAAPRKR